MNKNSLEEHIIHGTIDFPVAVYEINCARGDSTMFPIHYHKEFELFVLTGGRAKLRLDGETVYVKKGEGVFVNSGVLHSAVGCGDEKCSFVAVVFSPEIVSSRHEIIYERYIDAIIKNEMILPRALPEEVIKAVFRIQKLYCEKPFGYELFVKEMFLRIFGIFMKSEIMITEHKETVRYETIKAVLDYIHENYGENISLSDMAEYIHMSREHLCRVFREIAYSSPIEYLNRYRIMQSAYMLKNTQKSVSEISTVCGFNSSSYFNKLFFRYIKCTPTEYRKNETRNHDLESNCAT